MNLNKKSISIIRIIVVIITLIVGSWCVRFGIDYYRCTHKMAPVFAKSTGILDEDIETFNGMFYKIEQKNFTTPLGSIIPMIVERRMYLFGKRIYINCYK